MIKDKSIQDETLDKEEFSICTFASSSIDTSMPWPPLCRASILFVKTQEEKEHSNILKIEKKTSLVRNFWLLTDCLLYLLLRFIYFTLTVITSSYNFYDCLLDFQPKITNSSECDNRNRTSLSRLSELENFSRGICALSWNHGIVIVKSEKSLSVLFFCLTWSQYERIYQNRTVAKNKSHKSQVKRVRRTNIITKSNSLFYFICHKSYHRISFGALYFYENTNRYITCMTHCLLLFGRCVFIIIMKELDIKKWARKSPTNNCFNL